MGTLALIGNPSSPAEVIGGLIGNVVLEGAKNTINTLGALYYLINQKNKPLEKREFTLQENHPSCQPGQQFLNNLTEQNVQKAIPPRTYIWKTNEGYGFELFQSVGKSGLNYKLNVLTPDGSKFSLGSINVDKNQLNIKKNLSFSKTISWQTNESKHISKIELGLSVNPKGLGQLKLSLVGHDQSVNTFTLNPASCDFNFTNSNNLKINGGLPTDALSWAINYLDRTQKINHGNIYPGLIDILSFIKSDSSGVYRNHGSDGLRVLTQALNVLKNSGVNFEPLKQIQEKISKIPRKPNGMPTNEGSYKKLRSEAEHWLVSNIQKGVQSGKISVDSLRNSYGINFGIRWTGPDVQSAGPPTINPENLRFKNIDFIQLKKTIAKEGWELSQHPNGRLQLKDTGPVNRNFEKVKGILAQGLGVDAQHLKVLSPGPVYKIEVRLPVQKAK